MTISNTPTNYKDLNHTHIKQQMRENAEQRHSMSYAFGVLLFALLAVAIGYGVYAYIKMDNVPMIPTQEVSSNPSID